MSIYRSCPRELTIKGLRVKRKIGEKIIIEHGGERLIVQIVATCSGAQVILAFQNPAFKIHIREVENDDRKLD